MILLPKMDAAKLLKPNVDKIGITILLFLLTSFVFVLLTEPETVRAVWLLVLIPAYLASSFIAQSLLNHRLILKILRWVVFIPLSFLILISIISQFAPANPPEVFLITHNFMDLSDVLRMSKYRACAGHQTVDQWSDEPVSNMQHYITADPRVDRDQVEIYAPFDGYVLSDAPHTLADGITMIPKSGVPWWPFNQWRINFPHTHVLPEFQNSPIHEMKAGDVVGYINSLDRYGGVGKGTQVRVGVLAVPPMFKNGNAEPFKKLDSVFHYMTDEVFAEYEAAIPGLHHREDMIISKNYRLEHPCTFEEGGPSFLDNPPFFEMRRLSIELIPIEEQDVYIGVGINDTEGKRKKGMCDNPEDVVNNPECSDSDKT
ncbi:hypothetical protein HYU22_05690 [Candidatus Woesearchaeota archaeon]|nr:hypothetical protein [Candidatus Woesearchaeota archaeon]